MFIIRWILGRIILFFNFLFSPKRLKREASEQAAIDAQTESMQLYQYQACPFCVKVRREMRRNGLNIETVDAKKEENQHQLKSLGGMLQVPCLRIEEAGKVSWMYESSAINHYLNNRFS